MSSSILSAVAKHAQKTPKKLAVIVRQDTITYEQLWRHAVNAAEYLSKHGVSTGDRVVLSAASSTPSFIYGYLATHLLRAVVVPIDPKTPDARLAYIADRVEPSMIFTVTPTTTKTPAYTIDTLDISGTSTNAEFSYPNTDDMAEILFTSGTTGNPKGVILTHQNISSAASNINSFIGNSDMDREVVPLPLSHSFGLGRMRCNLLAGGALILTDGLTFPTQIFRSIEKWNATGLALVPAGFTVLLKLSNDRFHQYTDQLRYIEIGSAPMPIEHKQTLMAQLPATRICMHYGLTEASRATFIEFHESAHKLESIGQPTPNVEVRIIGENDSEMPPNCAGKIMVKGDMVMRGYWKDPHLDNEFLRGGWFYTGDYGYRDEQGYLFLEAREKDLINVGGRKVSPIEIENALSGHTGIAQCACIGILDPKGITGEAVKAYLVSNTTSGPNPSDNDLVDFLREILEPYKIPAAFSWVDAIPTTMSGKIQRSRLRDCHANDTN